MGLSDFLNCNTFSVVPSVINENTKMGSPIEFSATKQQQKIKKKLYQKGFNV
jgi:hypothetical protein